jgi:FAD binding domain
MTRFQDEIVLPGDEGWDEARRAYNLEIDQRPAEIVFPQSVEDVAAAVALAGERGWQIAAQGTGHNAGPLGSLENAILLKTDRMRGLTIDADARIGRAEAGVVWGEVVEAAAPHGLAGLAGTSRDVGVVGYSLGGGLSFLGRKYGLATNHLRAIELVTADGRFVRADHENEPDLFWALRGGGGSFGIVTAIEMQLLPIMDVYAGLLWYPIERGDEVLSAWREITQDDPPDDLTTWARFLNFPPIPDVPEPLRGKSFVAVEAYHLGDPVVADDRLAPLRALGPVNDTIQRMTMPALSHMHMDPEQPVPGIGDGLMLAALPAEALSAFIAVAGAGARVQLANIEVRHLEGELGRARPENGALASIEGKYAVFGGGFAAVPELVAPIEEQVEAIKEALAPWEAPHMYLNFAETRRDPTSLWTEQAYQRLRQIKDTVDPSNLILSNQPVIPAR